MHIRRGRTSVVHELEKWIMSSRKRYHDFEEAVQSARSHNVAEMDPILDLETYLTYLDETTIWAPTENSRGSEIFDRFGVVYFVLDQPSVISYQSPILPDQAQHYHEDKESKLETTVPPPPPKFLSTSTQHLYQDIQHHQQQCHHPNILSWLSAWMIRFGHTIGSYMDSPSSLTPQTLSTFRSHPSFRLHEYLEPHPTWPTFNAFFARRPKPGLRPIASIGSPSIIVSPADWTYNGALAISDTATVTIKSLTWRIAELLQDVPREVAGRFAGGTWIHGYLGTADYHRVHTPCAGVVRESRSVMGQHYAQIEARWVDEVGGVAEHRATSDIDAATVTTTPIQDQQQQQQQEIDDGVGPTTERKKRLHKRRVFDAPNETGYQFVQRRGLVLLETALGLVCVVPVGMSVVSSVVLTADVGVELHKGEEIGYFQFGGSDIVMLFERGPEEIKFTAEVGRHCKMGEQIGCVEL